MCRAQSSPPPRPLDSDDRLASSRVTRRTGYGTRWAASSRRPRSSSLEVRGMHRLKDRSTDNKSSAHADHRLQCRCARYSGGRQLSLVIDEVSLRGESSASQRLSALSSLPLDLDLDLCVFIDSSVRSEAERLVIMCDRLCFNINFIWSNQSVLTSADFPT